MRSETPFLTAQSKLVEGCNWLEDLARTEGDPLNECESHEDAWEQAEAHLSGAIADLEDHGTEFLENGGRDVPGFGWVPDYTVKIIDKPAVEAAALKALFKPLQDLQDVSAIAPMVTLELLASLRTVLAPHEQRMVREREIQESHPEPAF